MRVTTDSNPQQPEPQSDFTIELRSPTEGQILLFERPLNGKPGRVVRGSLIMRCSARALQLNHTHEYSKPKACTPRYFTGVISLSLFLSGCGAIQRSERGFLALHDQQAVPEHDNQPRLLLAKFRSPAVSLKN